MSDELHKRLLAVCKRAGLPIVQYFPYKEFDVPDLLFGPDRTGGLEGWLRERTRTQSFMSHWAASCNVWYAAWDIGEPVCQLTAPNELTARVLAAVEAAQRVLAQKGDA